MSLSAEVTGDLVHPHGTSLILATDLADIEEMKVLEETHESRPLSDLKRIEELLRWILVIQIAVLAEETVEFAIKLLGMATS
jgi:hypothetical protein